MTSIPRSIAELRERLTLQTRVQAPDSSGSVRGIWQSVQSLWASIETIDADQRVDAGQVGQRQTHRITIRYRTDIDTSNRFKRDDDIFIIRGIHDVDGRRRWLICLCEEMRS